MKPGAYVAQVSPDKKPSAALAASDVRSAAARVDESAAGIEQRAASMARESRSLREALGDLKERADVLRKQAATTEEEKAELWMRLTDVSRRALLLEDQANAAVKALDEQRELRRQATVRITEMEIAAREKDAEADKLRMQLADEAARGESAHKLAEQNAESAMQAKASADKLRGARNAALLFGFVALGVSGFLMWVNSVNPLAFLRK